MQSGIDLEGCTGRIRCLMPESENDTSKEKQVNSGWLGWIERVGNRLPDPATLFLIGTVLVMIASAVA